MTFEIISIDEFEHRVETFAWKRDIIRFQCHHTASPTRADWQKLESQYGARGAAQRLMEAMHRWHTKGRGWSDIGQHVSHFPDGLIGIGRDWNRTPAGIRGWNTGSFMTEIIGDLREGKEFPPPPAQYDSLVRSIAAIDRRFGLTPSSLMFHKDKAATACPGDIDKGKLVAAVADALEPENLDDSNETFEDVWLAAKAFFDSYFEAIR